MKRYTVFQKGNELRAVEADKFTAQDNITELINHGYGEVGSVMAGSAGHAVAEYESGNRVSAKESVTQSASVADSPSVSSYQTAVFVSKMISGFGWLIFAIGGLGMLAGFSAGSSRYGFDLAMAIAGATPGFVGMISGLLLVAAGQVMKATVDNADNTNQILLLMKDS
ncbi:hypothetical protein [Vibrio sp. WXL103]|uniref:hypothetical protein n=1 Tax=Vibrio sp. WXL103 TaxID=3450710 RepID=UPI003EC89104